MGSLPPLKMREPPALPSGPIAASIFAIVAIVCASIPLAMPSLTWVSTSKSFDINSTAIPLLPFEPAGFLTITLNTSLSTCGFGYATLPVIIPFLPPIEATSYSAVFALSTGIPLNTPTEALLMFWLEEIGLDFRAGVKSLYKAAWQAQIGLAAGVGCAACALVCAALVCVRRVKVSLWVDAGVLVFSLLATAALAGGAVAWLINWRHARDAMTIEEVQGGLEMLLPDGGASFGVYCTIAAVVCSILSALAAAYHVEAFCCARCRARRAEAAESLNAALLRAEEALCPTCSSPLHEADMFCAHCGAPPTAFG